MRGAIGTLAHGAWNSDLAYAFRQSPAAMLSLVVAAVLILGAVTAPWVAPTDPFDATRIDIMNALLPPSWLEGGNAAFPFGTDDQGRDVLSAILFGLRLSLAISVTAVVLSMVIGTVMGLTAAWAGGFVDALIMRLADIQLSFPAILVAMLVDGIVRNTLPPDRHVALAMPIVIVAIGLSGWVHFARTIRGVALVEQTKDYVQAARLIGVRTPRIVALHVLPNATGPIFVIATVQLATAMLTEATLSFLGLGMPPTQPSIGTMIRVGNDFLFSGEWWITLLPGIVLALLVLSVNLLGDWLRDALNPKLR